MRLPVGSRGFKLFSYILRISGVNIFSKYRNRLFIFLSCILYLYIFTIQPLSLNESIILALNKFIYLNHFSTNYKIQTFSCSQFINYSKTSQLIPNLRVQSKVIKKMYLIFNLVHCYLSIYLFKL